MLGGALRAAPHGELDWRMRPEFDSMGRTVKVVLDFEQRQIILVLALMACVPCLSNYLILQLARSCRAPAVEKNRKCNRAAIQSRQRPGSVPAVQRPKKGTKAPQKRGIFFFPQNGFGAQALGVETN